MGTGFLVFGNDLRTMGGAGWLRFNWRLDWVQLGPSVFCFTGVASEMLPSPFSAWWWCGLSAKQHAPFCPSARSIIDSLWYPLKSAWLSSLFFFPSFFLLAIAPKIADLPLWSVYFILSMCVIHLDMYRGVKKRLRSTRSAPDRTPFNNQSNRQKARTKVEKSANPRKESTSILHTSPRSRNQWSPPSVTSHHHSMTAWQKTKEFVVRCYFRCLVLQRGLYAGTSVREPILMRTAYLV